MPGLSNLNDKEFIRAFQVTDAVIQNNHPVFMFTWIGSIFSLLSTILISFVSFAFNETWLVVLLCVFYLFGVHGTTIAIHIPLNNHIQQVVIEELNDEVIAHERIKFEKKWNYFNNIRTCISILVSLLLLIQLSLH